MRARPALRSLTRDESGLAYLEFAIATPFLLALLMGAVEMTRYILIVQKVEKISVTISDVVAQGHTVTTSQLDNVITAAAEIMNPYEFGPRGYVIITSVKQSGNYSAANPPRVNWQYRGGGGWLQNSRVGSPGTSATLPNNMTLFDKDNVIVTEVFYNYAPLITTHGVLTGTALYKIGVFKPRLGDLSTLSWLPDMLQFWRQPQKGAVL